MYTWTYIWGDADSFLYCSVQFSEQCRKKSWMKFIFLFNGIISFLFFTFWFGKIISKLFMVCFLFFQHSWNNFVHLFSLAAKQSLFALWHLPQGKRWMKLVHFRTFVILFRIAFIIPHSSRFFCSSIVIRKISAFHPLNHSIALRLFNVRGTFENFRMRKKYYTCNTKYDWTNHRV